MTTIRIKTVGLAAFWLFVGGVYVWAAWQQKQRVNLSAAAGGQYPYLTYARGMAEQGVTHYLGDRNRMPLYPAGLSLVYDHDWTTFVVRAAWFATASSLVVLLGVGAIAYTALPGWPATAFTLILTVCVFLYKASFVQAELLYYGLFFVVWLIFCRLIRRPSAPLAVMGGLWTALAYLTKASILPTLVLFTVLMGLRSLVAVQRRGRVRADGEHVVAAPSRAWVCAFLVVITFVLISFPYLHTNKKRFGRYFYNVNTTFFMWCDNWPQASHFAERYSLDRKYPAAPASEIPGPVPYWKSHRLCEILNRERYGLATLASLGVRHPSFKYLALAAAQAVLLGWLRRDRLKEILRVHRWSMVFSLLLLIGYGAVYAWYVPVAYGDRFLLSLLAPALFATFWVSAQLSSSKDATKVSCPWLLRRDVIAFCLVVLLIGEGAVTVSSTLYKPSKEFVRFYYNESRQLQRSGRIEEAERGLRGVIQLDPTFAPAALSLGMIELSTGRTDAALASLSESVHLDPHSADAYNSFGSALIAAGRIDEAVTAFQRATNLAPEFAVAWYNLGGTYCLQGAHEAAERVRQRLESLNPRLARQLNDLSCP